MAFLHQQHREEIMQAWSESPGWHAQNVISSHERIEYFMVPCLSQIPKSRSSLDMGLGITWCISHGKIDA